MSKTLLEAAKAVVAALEDATKIEAAQALVDNLPKEDQSTKALASALGVAGNKTATEENKAEALKNAKEIVTANTEKAEKTEKN
jgi:hypothetical protein